MHHKESEKSMRTSSIRGRRWKRYKLRATPEWREFCKVIEETSEQCAQIYHFVTANERREEILQERESSYHSDSQKGNNYHNNADSPIYCCLRVFILIWAEKLDDVDGNYHGVNWKAFTCVCKNELVLMVFRLKGHGANVDVFHTMMPRIDCLVYGDLSFENDCRPTNTWPFIKQIQSWVIGRAAYITCTQIQLILITTELYGHWKWDVPMLHAPLSVGDCHSLSWADSTNKRLYQPQSNKLRWYCWLDKSMNRMPLIQLHGNSSIQWFWFKTTDQGPLPPHVLDVYRVFPEFSRVFPEFFPWLFFSAVFSSKNEVKRKWVFWALNRFQAWNSLKMIELKL